MVKAEELAVVGGELLDAEADRAWGRSSRNIVVVHADLVDRGGRALIALGRQGTVQTGEVLAGEELELATGGGGGGGNGRGELRRHFECGEVCGLSGILLD